MKIHEYQGKEIFKKHNIATPNGIPAFTVEEALEAYNSLKSDIVAVKAQIHAGGRGKGGGVKIAKNKDEAEKHIKNIFGMNLITHQTGEEGKKVERLYLESGVDIKSEFYAAITLDRSKEMDVFMVSTEGGVEIEKVASEFEGAVDLKKIIEDNIAAFDLDRLEAIVHQVAQREFRTIERLGAVLGFVIGLVQVALLWATGTVSF